jgi:hypothetical protein
MTHCKKFCQCHIDIIRRIKKLKKTKKRITNSGKDMGKKGTLIHYWGNVN